MHKYLKVFKSLQKVCKGIYKYAKVCNKINKLHIIKKYIQKKVGNCVRKIKINIKKNYEEKNTIYNIVAIVL